LLVSCPPWFGAPDVDLDVVVERVRVGAPAVEAHTARLVIVRAGYLAPVVSTSFPWMPAPRPAAVRWSS
jgi:hypothetical protein